MSAIVFLVGGLYLLIVNPDLPGLRELGMSKGTRVFAAVLIFWGIFRGWNSYRLYKRGNQK